MWVVKHISFRLSTADIGKAIRELERYRQEIAQKTEMFRKRIADEIAATASDGFGASIVNDLLDGGSRQASVEVTTREDGKITVVMATGKDAVWCEFGAGVYHNGAVGSSPHPNGEELGMTIGSYGEGRGARSTWGFYEDDKLKLTHGTPATMPMYNAAVDVCSRISEIAREVFG